MKKIVDRLTVAAMVVTIILGLGYSFSVMAKTKKENSVSGAKNEPAWVTKCAGAFPDAGKDAFYGCGSATGISNPSLQMQTADERARADLAKTLDTYVANFFKDFMSSASVTDKTKTDKDKKDKKGNKGGLTETEEEQFVSSITKEITETTLNGVEISDHFRSPEDQTLFSLAKVSFDNMSKSMEKQMRQRAAEIKMDADDAVKEMDQQLEKRRQSGN